MRSPLALTLPLIRHWLPTVLNLAGRAPSLANCARPNPPAAIATTAHGFHTTVLRRRVGLDVLNQVRVNRL